MKIATKIFILLNRKVKQITYKEKSTCRVSAPSYDADLFAIFKAYNEKLLIIYANIRV